MFKSVNAVWFNPEVVELLQQDPKTLSHDQLVTVALELDRRITQLWDKVTFERDRSLVDYSKLKL